jgi:hypothetical protein
MTTKTGVFKSENVLDRNFEGPFNSSLAINGCLGQLFRNAVIKKEKLYGHVRNE